MNALPRQIVTEDFHIRQSDATAEIEIADRLVAEVFGPGRYAKTAYRLREKSGDQASVYFIAHDHRAANTKIIGCLRLTPVKILMEAGVTEDFYLLGPVAVAPDFQGAGVGTALMKAALTYGDQAQDRIEQMILVGDEGYYGRFGFRLPYPTHKIMLPGPADLNRVLVRQCL